MRICVFGLYNLGSVPAACLAKAGHDVFGLERDGGVVEHLRQSVLPLSQPQFAELLSEGPDTPVDEDDRADIASVVEQVRATLPPLRDGAVVLVSAQLPAGRVAVMEAAFNQTASGRRLSFACSLENLRLGRAIENFRDPGRIVIGIRDENARKVLEIGAI